MLGNKRHQVKSKQASLYSASSKFYDRTVLFCSLPKDIEHVSCFARGTEQPKVLCFLRYTPLGTVSRMLQDHFSYWVAHVPSKCLTRHYQPLLSFLNAWQAFTKSDGRICYIIGFNSLNTPFRGKGGLPRKAGCSHLEPLATKNDIFRESDWTKHLWCMRKRALNFLASNIHSYD